MKNVLKLEYLGLLIFFSSMYFQFFPGSWGIFLALFFVPDISFAAYLISKKAGAIVYNCLHHQGLMAVVFGIGYFNHQEWLMRIGLIFLAHSFFDRVAGYGLKYPDSFDHTHLGWIGKSKNLNKAEPI